jgi:hypothetical protein
MYGSCLLHGSFPVGSYVVREAKNGFRPHFLDETIHEYVGFFNFFIRHELKLDRAVPRCMGDSKGEQVVTVEYHKEKDRHVLETLCRQVYILLFACSVCFAS